MKKSGPKVNNLEDEKLAELVKGGNKDAYQELVRRFRQKLFSYVYRMAGNKEETEDIVQNVFVKTYNNIKRFDTSRKFSSWIYRIAHNETINSLKKRDKKKMVSWEDLVSSKDKLETKSEERSPIDAWMKKESKREIQKALESLPEKYREVLMLRYFSDKSYEEIGKIIKKPVNTVGTLINRAKRKLHDIVEENQ